ncbi:MAG: helix-turn-helix transcriptional regulator [Clostridia bacterium]|nr:helix-turn-helix transcriptional regulator [Clostridia bacterium]
MIGDRLKDIRSDFGDTQQKLADKLNVSRYTVQSWEQGKSSPSNEMLVKICRMYNVSSDFLLGLSDADPVFFTRREQKLNQENLKILRKFEDFLINEQSNNQ